MPIPPNLYPVPGPGVGPQAPNYEDTYGAMGLSGLAQGFTHGLELGHQWGEKADELQARKDQMANEAAARQGAATELHGYHQGELKAKEEHLSFLKDQASKNVEPVYGPDGSIVGWQTRNGGMVKAAGAGSAKDVDAANAAITGLENLKGQIHDIGFGKSVGTSNLMALKNWALSKIGGTKAHTYKTQSIPTMMVTAHNLSNRFSMPELPAMLEGTGGFTNTESSAVGNLDVIEDQIRSKAGIKKPLAPPPGAGGAVPPPALPAGTYDWRQHAK